jgi:membrane fusion protein (multidrug efflux system)
MAEKPLGETLSSDGENDFISVPQETIEEPPKRRRNPLGAVIGLIVLAGVLAYGLKVFHYNSTHVTTDDAYVTSDVIPVNVRVAGVVEEVLVDDNQQVKKGDLLVQLDDRTYRAEVAQAEANLALAQAAAGGAATDVQIATETGRAQVAQAESGVDVGESDIASAQANVRRAESAVTTAQSTLRSTQADVLAARAVVASRRSAVARIQDQVVAAKAAVASAESAVKAAQANYASSEAAASNAQRDAVRTRTLAEEGALSVAVAEQRETAARTAAANAEAVRQQIESAKALVDQRRADLAAVQDQVREAQSAIRQAEAQATAVQRMVGVQSARIQESQSAVRAAEEAVRAAAARRRQNEAKLEEAVGAAKRTGVSQAARLSSLAKVKQAAAALEAAKLNLARTRIVAPRAGTVSRRSVQIGQQVSPAQPMMALLPDQDPWIVANFKETQLGSIRPGEPVEVHIDALPDYVFKGTVESLSQGTGATFALLPPDNATGNFTKVVQRVPVKIVLAPGQAHLELLRSGLSSTVAIEVRS